MSLVVYVSEDYKEKFQQTIDSIRNKPLKEKLMDRFQCLEETLKIHKIASSCKKTG